MNPSGYHHGPQAEADGRIRFRLWAPDVSSVTLELSDREPVAMQALADGWFEHVAACEPGTRYRFGVGPLSVPDPASRRQDRDVHDASVVVDPSAYTWQHDDWRGRPWHETVLYELHPGLLGGYAGVQARLPELASLGITAIELMPVADFPGPRNWGYDGVLPYAPDSAYGTPDELKALVDAAHGLGMMVFLDVVYNHFGPDGNYLGLYASGFFRDDIPTPWGPAIDFRRVPVRQFFAENALYWLREFRFDGLRLDAVHAIADPGWLDDMASWVRRQLPDERHVHLVLENDDNAAQHMRRQFDAQWNDDAHHALHVLLTGETDGYYGDYAQAPEELLARCLSEGFAYQGEPSPHRSGRPRGEPSADLAPTAFVLFLQNHDQTGNRANGERLTSLLQAQPPRDEPNPLAAAVALTLLAPQIPMVFMGEECGSTAPFLFFTSHNEQLALSVFESRKKEFGSFASFSGERGGALPDPNARSTFAASQPFDRPADAPAAALWSAYYWRLLSIRRETLMPVLPGTRSLGSQVLGKGCVAAAWQLGDGRRLTLTANLGQTDLAGTGEQPLGADAVLFESRQGIASLAEAGTLAAGSLLARLSGMPST